MSISDLIEPVSGRDGPATLANAADSMQGRTLYGGASALLAYTHVQKKFADLPPLRSAQIAFVAPIGEEIELSATIVRQGRNVTQVRSDIHCDSGVALTAFWLFGSARESNAIRETQPLADWPGAPESNAVAMQGKGPHFLQENFDVRFGQPEGADHGAVIRRWARLKEHDQLDPVSRLILMGDVMPPGAMRIMQRKGPISSINWTFNLLQPEPHSPDGWFLSENASHHAGSGYSSEHLRMWDVDGRQVLDGLQCVAIFG